MGGVECPGEKAGKGRLGEGVVGILGIQDSFACGDSYLKRNNGVSSVGRPEYSTSPHTGGGGGGDWLSPLRRSTLTP